MRTFEAKGGFAPVGEAVGEATREDVRFVCEAVVPYVEKMTRLKSRDEVRSAALPFLRASEAFFPPAFEYLRGLARGAGIAFEDLVPVLFDEELCDTHGKKEKCSTLVVREPGGGWCVGHNEDYDDHYRGRLTLLDLAFDGWPRLLAVSYPGKLPGVGGTLNDAGISVTNNSLAAAAVAGISTELRGFRAALSRTFDEAAEALTAQPSSLPVHFYLFSAPEGRAASIEVGNEASSSLLSVRSDLERADAHTNTVLRLPLTVADGCSENSRARYAKLTGLIAEGRLPADSADLMRLLTERDRMLNRQPGDGSNGVTLASVVIRPASGELWIHEEGTKDDSVHRYAI